jgi:hypothetical protein
LNKPKDTKRKTVDLNSYEGNQFLEGLVTAAQAHSDTLNFVEVKKHYILCWDVFAKKNPSIEELKEVIYSTGIMITLIEGQSEKLLSIHSDERFIYNSNYNKWIDLFKDLWKKAKEKKKFIKRQLEENTDKIPKKQYVDFYSLLKSEKISNKKLFISNIVLEYKGEQEHKAFAYLALAIEELGLVNRIGSSGATFASLIKVFGKEKTGTRQNFAKHKDNCQDHLLRFHIDRVRHCLD